MTRAAPGEDLSISYTELGHLLAMPFEPDEVDALPKTIRGNKAQAVFYIDARSVAQRLDDVMGPANWWDDYVILDKGSVVCRLSVRFGDRVVTKVDVGSLSEQEDAGDQLKAAFSDSYKRAAVKFGIGRFLYSIPFTWLDFDPQSRRFVKPPVVPREFWPRRTEKQADLIRALLVEKQIGPEKYKAYWKKYAERHGVEIVDDGELTPRDADDLIRRLELTKSPSNRVDAPGVAQ